MLREFNCFMTPSSDWRFWFRSVVSTQAIGVVLVVVLFEAGVPIIAFMALAGLCWTLRHRLSVSDDVVIIRWVFSKKCVERRKIMNIKYESAGVLGTGTLEICTDKARIRVRAQRTILRAIGGEIEQRYGIVPMGTIKLSGQEDWLAPALIVLAAVLGLALGFMSFAR